MSKKDFFLNINSPCNQLWSEMESIGNDKFCSNCVKSVTDLTSLNDNELADFIKNQKGTFCGKLTSNQINKPFKFSHSEKNQFPISKVAATLLLLIGISKSGQTKEFQNQTFIKIPFSQNQSVKKANIDEIDRLKNDSLNNIISGKVLDKETIEAVPFANVVILNTDIGTTSDLDGNFSLEIPIEKLDNEITIQISFVGYAPINETFKKTDFPLKKDFQVFMLSNSLIGVICVEHKKHWWQFWK